MPVPLSLVLAWQACRGSLAPTPAVSDSDMELDSANDQYRQVETQYEIIEPIDNRVEVNGPPHAPRPAHIQIFTEDTSSNASSSYISAPPEYTTNDNGDTPPSYNPPSYTSEPYNSRPYNPDDVSSSGRQSPISLDDLDMLPPPALPLNYDGLDPSGDTSPTSSVSSCGDYPKPNIRASDYDIPPPDLPNNNRPTPVTNSANIINNPTQAGFPPVIFFFNPSVEPPPPWQQWQTAWENDRDYMRNFWWVYEQYLTIHYPFGVNERNLTEHDWCAMREWAGERAEHDSFNRDWMQWAEENLPA